MRVCVLETNVPFHGQETGFYQARKTLAHCFFFSCTARLYKMDKRLPFDGGYILHSQGVTWPGRATSQSSSIAKRTLDDTATLIETIAQESLG